MKYLQARRLFSWSQSYETITSVFYERNLRAISRSQTEIAAINFEDVFYNYVFCIVCILQTNTFNLQAIFTSNFLRKVS